jgi:hypothetical protein
MAFLTLGVSELNCSRPCPSNTRKPSRSMTPTAMSGACRRANCFTCRATDSGMWLATTMATATGCPGRWRAQSRASRIACDTSGISRSFRPSDERFISMTYFLPRVPQLNPVFHPRRPVLPGPSIRLGETLRPRSSRPEPLCRAVNRERILAWHYHGHVIYHGRVNYPGQIIQFIPSVNRHASCVRRARERR